MAKHARVEAGLVIETYVPPEGLTLAECFHADVAAQFTACADDVEEGWTYQGGVFAAPVLPELPPERLDPLLAPTAMMERIDEIERRVKMLEDRAPTPPRRNRSSDPTEPPH